MRFMWQSLSCHSGRGWAGKVSLGTWESRDWVCGSCGDWEGIPEWRNLVWGGAFFLSPPSEGNELKEPFFPTSPFCFTMQGSRVIMDLGFVKSSQPVAGCHMFCFALFSCCQFDAVKHYAAQVKCVLYSQCQRELTELIPIGCTHLSPFNQWHHTIGEVIHLLLLQHFICAAEFNVHVQRILKTLPKEWKHLVSLWQM